MYQWRIGKAKTGGKESVSEYSKGNSDTVLARRYQTWKCSDSSSAVYWNEITDVNNTRMKAITFAVVSDRHKTVTRRRAFVPVTMWQIVLRHCVHFKASGCAQTDHAHCSILFLNCPVIPWRPDGSMIRLTESVTVLGLVELICQGLWQIGSISSTRRRNGCGYRRQTFIRNQKRKRKENTNRVVQNIVTVQFISAPGEPLDKQALPMNKRVPSESGSQ